MRSLAFAAEVLLLFTALPGCGFAPRLLAQSSPSPKSTGPNLPIPPANACQSPYDSFYQSEPGVYAFWALCESNKSQIGYDYAGGSSLVKSFVPNVAITGGIPGPVPDGESGARAPDAQFKLERQGVFLNKHAGTLAAWINASATASPVSAESFPSVTGSSRVAIAVSEPGKECFSGEFTNAAGKAFHATDCRYSPNSWHRIIVIWNAQKLSLYVDGELRTSTPYTGSLDDSIFYYQLFPGCCKTGKQMTLAKVAVANRAWTSAQIAQDFAPVLIPPPLGGVEVSNQPLGTIHKDVLGYVDSNQDISSPSILAALRTGLHAAGVTAVRYSGGGSADAEDWRGGPVDCTSVKGRTTSPRNRTTEDNLQNYITRVAQPLHLSIDFVVNYGSNPPACNDGGDPIANGANLVRYANLQKHFGIERWEIGNEQYAYGGGPLIDLHPNGYLAANGDKLSTYINYEPAFYDAMKAADPTIEIAVPALSPEEASNTLIHYEIPLLAHGKFDALILHSYPITNPITDGTTLYPDRVASGTQIRGALLSFQTQLLNEGKPPDAIWVTEWDAQPAGNEWSKQTLGAVMPLFAAMQLAEYMQAGVPFASWQAQGETDVCSSYNYDDSANLSYNWWNGCGDPALTYTGPVAGVGEQQIGLKPGDLTPAARAFQLLSQSGFVSEGERMLRTQNDPVNAPWLMAYAATHGAAYEVLLINRDRNLSHTVPVAFESFKTGGAVTQWTYGRNQYDSSRTGNWSVGPTSRVLGPWSTSFLATLPPWSVNVLVFTKPGTSAATSISSRP